MSYLKNFLNQVKNKNEYEIEFLQAVEEFAHSVIPFVNKNAKYKNTNLLAKIVEPERVVIFRVPWIDDKELENPFPEEIRFFL